ncbi:LOW QUALITY PROTEIN: G2/M phase-specific E3 ubiquitin-protein ligase-like [Oculina patagonica]
MDETFSESDVGEDGVGDVQPPAASQENEDIAEIVGELAEVVNVSMLSKFNISHNFLWEGTKRALSVKSFSPENKVSVKFTDNAGASEGAVDLGGPMREFFTLALQYLHDSQVFCGSENCKFLSFQSKCLQDEDYHAAGTIIAMSIVHGGPGPQFLSPLMQFEALISDLSKLAGPVQAVYDIELHLSLQTLLNSASPEKAMKNINEGNLPTILDLAGTLAPVTTMEYIPKIVYSTTQWFVLILGRAQPALESFKKGLSSLGVLEAVKAHPAAFRAVFCSVPDAITAESMETLFSVTASPVGSTKVVTERLVLSRWRDYLQDIEEGEESIALSDILFLVLAHCKIPLFQTPIKKLYENSYFYHHIFLMPETLQNC